MFDRFRSRITRRPNAPQPAAPFAGDSAREIATHRPLHARMHRPPRCEESELSRKSADARSCCGASRKTVIGHRRAPQGPFSQASEHLRSRGSR